MTDTPAARSRVKRTLDGFGAKITREHDNGEIDFSLDGLDGFARDSGGWIRASVFLEYDPDPVEAEAWVAAHDDVAYAKVQFIVLVDGTALRLLIEMPFEEREQIWAALQTVRGLHAAWLNRNDGGADLATTLGSSGIVVPPLGVASTNNLYSYGAWSWGSRYVPPSVLYMYEARFVARQLIEHGPMFAMAHAGRGINSYGLNVVTTSPSGVVAAYMQHSYGGAYADPVADLIAINATYSRLHVLLRGVAKSPVEPVRWLLMYSQFRGVCGVADLEKLRRGDGADQGIDRFDSETDLFEAMVGRLHLEASDFGTGGRVTW